LWWQLPTFGFSYREQHKGASKKQICLFREERKEGRKEGRKERSDEEAAQGRSKKLGGFATFIPS
jgi:hypothetical protein